MIGPVVADTRRRAAALGRDTNDLLFFSMATVITGATEEEAKAKLASYRRYLNPQAALILFSGWTALISRSSILMRRSASTGRPTVWCLPSKPSASPTRTRSGRHASLPSTTPSVGRGPVFIGSPEQVADQIEAWVDATDVDGLNLSYAGHAGGISGFGTLRGTALQRRGRFKHAYAPGTLREKLYGPDRGRLPASHPAARAVRPRAAATSNGMTLHEPLSASAAIEEAVQTLGRLAITEFRDRSAAHEREGTLPLDNLRAIHWLGLLHATVSHTNGGLDGSLGAATRRCSCKSPPDLPWRFRHWALLPGAYPCLLDIENLATPAQMERFVRPLASRFSLLATVGSEPGRVDMYKFSDPGKPCRWRMAGYRLKNFATNGPHADLNHCLRRYRERRRNRSKAI